MNEMLLSAFGLCATNGGLFKSEKQAQFFAHKWPGESSSPEPYRFGPRGGCRRPVGYSAYFDEQGFTQIVKYAAKGEVLLFERGGINTYADNRALKDERKAVIRANVIADDIPRLEAAIAAGELAIAKERDEATARERDIKPLMPIALWDSLSVSLGRKLAELLDNVESYRSEIKTLKAQYEIE